jgi:hypothetical protein
MKAHNLQITGSIPGNQTINGNLVVTGSLTAQQFIVSSSVMYVTESFASGSHVFGNDSSDTHQFTGSVYMTGSLYVTSSVGMPLELLHLDGNGIRFRNASSSGKRWDIVSSGDNFVINETGVSARLFISSSGNLGMGTSAPDNTYQGLTLYGTNPSLRLKGSAGSSWTWIEYATSGGTNNFSMGVNQSIPAFVIKAGAGLDSPHFAIDTNGRIGLGTTTPTGRLDVASRGITVGSMPVGSVIQTVTYNLTTGFSTSSSSDQDSGLKVSITPTSSTSKILVLVSANIRATNSGGNCYAVCKLVRGAFDTGVALHNGYAVMGNFNSTDIRGSVSYSYLDSPATTSSTQYVVSMNSTYAATVYMNSTTSPSTITLMEIAQ